MMGSDHDGFEDLRIRRVTPKNSTMYPFGDAEMIAIKRLKIFISLCSGANHSEEINFLR